MTTALAGAEILRDLVQGRANVYAPAFDPSRPLVKAAALENALFAAGSVLTPTAPRCPHLGCALRYNRAERSWDCPAKTTAVPVEGRRRSDFT